MRKGVIYSLAYFHFLYHGITFLLKYNIFLRMNNIIKLYYITYSTNPHF